MNDDQVALLKAYLESKKRLAWIDGGDAKELTSVVPCIESLVEEVAEPGPCAFLRDDTWIALDNVDPSSIFVIQPLFQ